MKLGEALKRSYELYGRMTANRYPGGLVWLFDADQKKLAKFVGFGLHGEPMYNMLSMSAESLEDYDDWESAEWPPPEETDT